ncbi:MAG: hypothetical protein LBS33_07665 [Streptococcaceae bacterium]|jgi:GTP1/Obg family GTP-binding protein|nr:hypothetical protein [Streptococcaceae bacterium]
MDNNERWQLEEAYDDQMRMVNQAQEMFDDYRSQFRRKTSDLADYVNHFYRDLAGEYGGANNQPFEQSVDEFNWLLKQKQQALEDMRDELQRDFHRKMDES